MRFTNEELTKKINELVIKWKGKKPKHEDILDPVYRSYRTDQLRYWSYKDWLRNSAKKNEKSDTIPVEQTEEFWTK